MRIRNLSTKGVLLDGLGLPVEESVVTLLRGQLIAGGMIVWVLGDQRGLRFDSEISVNDWSKRVGHGDQQRIDAEIDRFRRDDRQHVSLDATDTLPTPQRLQAMSDDLREIAERLVGSAELSVQFADELLKLDVIAQELGQCSSEVERSKKAPQAR